jgi:hypothetical protein
VNVPKQVASSSEEDPTMVRRDRPCTVPRMISHGSTRQLATPSTAKMAPVTAP